MNRKILRLAIPNILSNLSIPLLSSVDTAVVGRLEHVYYLGAIAVGSMIFNFIYWGFGFLRMGTTGIIAQAYGRKDRTEIGLTLYRALLTAVGVGFLLILFSGAIDKLAFSIISSSSEVETYAREYFYIRIFAAPAALSLYVFHGWFLGMQNAKYPLFLSVFVNALNIVLDLVFIYGLGMKSDGVAYGTLIAQYLGLTAAVILFSVKYRNALKNIIIKKIADLEKIKQFLKLNFDIFLRTLALIFVFSFFTVSSAAMGDDVLAANTILLQLWLILAYGVDGFAFAAESLTGKYFGEKNREKLKSVVRFTFYWGLGLGTVLSILYTLFSEQILFLFTDKDRIIALASVYFIYTAVAPVVNSICMIWDGVYIGATASKPMRNTMIIAAFGIFLPFYFLLSGTLGNHALWIAMVAFMIARGLSLTLLARKSIINPVVQ